jgi:hypothetical protein
MNDRGASLVATIFILVILSLFGAALCILVAMEADTGVRDSRSKQALALAEAGIDMGLWNLHGDFENTWAPDPATEYSLGGGTFTMELITGAGGSETLRAVGYVPNRTGTEATRTAEVTGVLVPDPLHGFYAYALWLGVPPTLDYGLYSITTSGRGRADFYAGGDIVFRNGSGGKVDGAVRSTGTVTKESWSGDDPWKTMEEDVDVIEPPPLDGRAEDWYRQNAYSVLEGNRVYQNITMNFQNGRIYFVDGNVTVGDLTVTGEGAIVATGDVTISGTVGYRRSADGPLALVAFEDILCGQSTDPIDASLYAGGTMTVPSAGTIAVHGNLGASDGYSLANGTNITISYDRRLGSWAPGEKVLPTSPSRNLSWREVYK